MARHPENLSRIGQLGELENASEEKEKGFWCQLSGNRNVAKGGPFATLWWAFLELGFRIWVEKIVKKAEKSENMAGTLKSVGIFWKYF